MQKILFVPLLLVLLSACGGGSSGTTPPVGPPLPITGVPSVEIDNISVVEGQAISIQPTVTDNGTITGYRWVQLTGAELSIDNTDSEELNFLAPAVTEEQVYRFELTVTDNDGNRVTSEVQVIVTPNMPPQVSMTDQTVQEGQTVEVVAQASDQDGGVESFSWYQTGGDPVTFDYTENALTFVAPDVSVDSTFTFTVEVFDGYGKSTIESTSVLVERNEVDVTLAGKIANPALIDARISVTVGDDTFTAQSDDQGRYTLSLKVAEEDVEQVALLTAQGSGSEDHINLTSVLGSITSLINMADDASEVTDESLFALNPSHFTTALEIELGRIAGSTQSQEALIEAYSQLDTTALFTTMQVSKALENSSAAQDLQVAEADVDNTRSFVGDAANVSRFVDAWLREDEAGYQSAQRELFSDTALSRTAPEERMFGNYVMFDLDKRGSMLTSHSNVANIRFRSTNEAVLVDEYSMHYLTWSVEQGNLSFVVQDGESKENYEFCRMSPRTNTSTFCDRYLTGVDLFFLPFGEQGPLNILIRSMRFEDDDVLTQQRNFTFGRMQLAEEITSPLAYIDFGTFYSFSIPRQEKESQQYWNFHDDFTETLNTVMVRFDAPAESGGNSGVVQVLIPTFNGEQTNLVAHSGTWLAKNDNSMLVQIDDSDFVDYLAITFNDKVEIRLEANVALLDDFGNSTVVSDQVLVSDDVVMAFTATNAVGVYYTYNDPTQLLNKFWIDIQEGGVGQIVSTNDENLDGVLEQNEVTIMPLRWQITHEGRLQIRRYRSISEGFGSNAYCEPEAFSPPAGADCVMQNDREWWIWGQSTDSNGIEKFQLFASYRLYNYYHAHFSGGEPYDGTDVLFYLNSSNLTYEKHATPPIDISAFE